MTQVIDMMIRDQVIDNRMVLEDIRRILRNEKAASPAIDTTRMVEIKEWLIDPSRDEHWKPSENDILTILSAFDYCIASVNGTGPSVTSVEPMTLYDYNNIRKDTGLGEEE